MRRELEQKLRERIEQARRKRPHGSARDWDGSSYGYGRGRAHPSVEFVPCPHCQAPPGQLCRGAHGPHYGTHFMRGRLFKALQRKVMDDDLAGAQSSSGRGDLDPGGSRKCLRRRRPPREQAAQKETAGAAAPHVAGRQPRAFASCSSSACLPGCTDTSHAAARDAAARAVHRAAALPPQPEVRPVQRLRNGALLPAAMPEIAGELKPHPFDLRWVWFYSSTGDLPLQCVERGLLGEEAAEYATLERAHPARENAARARRRRRR